MEHHRAAPKADPLSEPEFPSSARSAFANTTSSTLLTAFICFSTDSGGFEQELVDRLTTLVQVEEIYLVDGNYDMLIKVAVPSRADLTRLLGACAAENGSTAKAE